MCCASQHLYANSNFKEFQKYLHYLYTSLYSFTHIAIHLLKINHTMLQLIHHFGYSPSQQRYSKLFLQTISKQFLNIFPLQLMSFEIISQMSIRTTFVKELHRLFNFNSLYPLLILSNFSMPFKTVDHIFFF